MNDSSTGGYLVNGGSAPLQDAALDAILQAVVVGVTGLDGSLVRPRWQPVIPKQPEPGTDWCAIGVTEFVPFDYPVEEHLSDGQGSDVQTEWDELTVLASFYGPNCGANAKNLARGVYVAQNREALQLQGMDVTDAGPPRVAPEFKNQQYIRRFDVPIQIRRKSQRTFPVLNLKYAPFALTTN